MPFGDKTGPLGQGPGTGRGAGFCRGRRNWFQAAGLTGREQKLPALPKSPTEHFEAALEDIRKRLEGLESKAKPE